MRKRAVPAFLSVLVLAASLLVSAAPASAVDIDVRGRWSGTVTVEDDTWIGAPYSLWCPTFVEIHGTLTASYVGRADLDVRFSICGGGPGLPGPSFEVTTPSGTISADIVLFTVTDPGVVRINIAEITATGRFEGLNRRPPPCRPALRGSGAPVQPGPTQRHPTCVMAPGSLVSGQDEGGNRP